MTYPCDLDNRAPPHETTKMCCCLSWPFKDVQYEAAPKYRNTTTGYRYQWNGQSWDLQEIQVPTVSSCRRSFCHFATAVVARRTETRQAEKCSLQCFQRSLGGLVSTVFAILTPTRSLMSGCPDTNLPNPLRI